MCVVHRLVPVVLALTLSARVYALELPETGITYDIEVALDPETRLLDGRETIRWRNPSRAPVGKIPLHLYLNGFAHDDTTWMRSVAESRVQIDDLLKVYDDPWGWSEPRLIRQGDAEVAWAPIAPDDGNPNDRSLIEITLAEPVPPGETLELTVEFDAKLPIPIARTGGYKDFFFVAQWFPKISAFETVGVRGADKDRWAGHQFHGHTEFYADHADFDVRIQVPVGWKVAATGQGGPKGEAGSRDLQRHVYRQRAVHDFAFAAGQHMVDSVSTYQPAGSGGPVEIHIFLPQGTEHQAQRWRKTVEGSLDVLGTRVGPYPYQTMTLVLPPWRALRTCGMEYPTLVTGMPADPLWDVGFLSGMRVNEVVISHEFVHQYFYGVVATNEFQEAFLDEGFTQFWGHEAMIGTYGDEAGGGTLLGRSLRVTSMERAGLLNQGNALPVLSRPSYLVHGESMGTQFYTRPATILRTAAGMFGDETMDRVFADFYQRWAFRHPRFEDFLAVARDSGGDDVADFIFEAYTQSGVPDYRVLSLETNTWSPPRGRLVTTDGAITSDDEKESLEGLDPSARENDGLVLMEVLDPGWTRTDQQVPGRIERRHVTPQSGKPDDDWELKDGEFHLSQVRLRGPGWDHLPVEVWFRFADGSVVQETWDGRARYRDYRFLRAAPLSEVRVDPQGRIAMDRDLANNARLRQADTDLVSGWSAWLAAVFQLLLEGLTQWL